jgi:large-conductance mechanosensitive channel
MSLGREIPYGNFGEFVGHVFHFFTIASAIIFSIHSQVNGCQEAAWTWQEPSTVEQSSAFVMEHD